MSNQYILAIDQSTSGTKAMLFNTLGEIAARADLSHKQITNDKGWVEHNPNEIWGNLLHVVKLVVEKAGIAKEDIKGVGISNQRETAVLWDKTTGAPICNAIVWQCARGADICEEIEKGGASDHIKEITGLHLSPYFTAAKIAWALKEFRPNLSNLCAGTMDSWLIYKLTGGKEFKTDYSNASRTQLFDLQSLTWSEDIACYFGIPTAILAKAVPSDSLFGYTDFSGYLPVSIPIHSVLGDSHGALFGQGCNKSGMIKTTYGTGSSVMMNIGEKPIKASDGIVTSIAWGFNGKVNYVLEGNINYTGAVMKWIVDDLGLLASPKDAENMAMSANKQDKTYLVPAFSGLSAPYWNSDARAILCGMSRTTRKAEIVKAAEESIALQIADIITVMNENIDINISTLRVDGGPTRDKFLMQFQSDILGITVEVAAIEELSGLGAAYMAGLAMSFYSQSSLEGVGKKVYSPQMTEDQRRIKLDGWKNALSLALGK